MQRTLDLLNTLPAAVNSVRCPLCSLNISEFELNERESHVESCLAELEFTTDKDSSTDSLRKERAERAQRAEKPKKQKKHKPLRQLPKFKILTFHLKYPKPLIIKSNEEQEQEQEEEGVVGEYNEYKFQINVDGFNFSKHANIEHYFLSHFHADHYIGLTKSWNKGSFIFTSHQTLNLSIWRFHLENVGTVGLDFEKWHEIYRNQVDNDTEVVKVKLYDANHCPGGAIFLFEHTLNDICKRRVLHTGDFRVSKNHIMEFKDLFLDQIYLDTTYLNPKYLFLEQSKLVRKTGDFIKGKLFKDDEFQVNKPSILSFFNKGSNNTKANSWVILIGSYSIGKENLYLHLSRVLNSKIYISRDKFEMLCKCLTREVMESYFSVEDNDCLIHVVPIAKLSDPQFINKNYHNRNIIKLKPTGWSFAQYLVNPNHTELIKKTNSGKILNQEEKQTYLDQVVFQKDDIEETFEKNLDKMFEKSNSLNIPYSEHSNFKELTMLCGFVEWGEIIPTVMNNYGKYTKRKIDEAFCEDVRQEIKEEALPEQIVVDLENEEDAEDLQRSLREETPVMKDNNDDFNDNEEGEFERWFKVWKDYKITIDQIEEYYGRE